MSFGYDLRAEYYTLEFNTSADFELLRDVISGGRLVLEVPAGAGRLLPLYATLPQEVIMVDAEPRMTRMCLRRILEYGLGERVHAHTGDIRTLRPAQRPDVVIVPHGGLQLLPTLRDVSAALERLTSAATPGSTLYVDLANPWDADVSALGLLPPFMAPHETTGEQVFENDRLEMRRSWHSRADNESLEVSFTYDIIARPRARIAHYSAQSRWLRVRPGILLNELYRLGVTVSNTFGHHDGRQYVPGAPRFIVIGSV